MGTIEMITLALSFADKLMDKLPNYPEHKRNQFYKLRKEYLDACNADYKVRDDNLVSQKYLEVKNWLSVFDGEIKK